MYLHLKLSILCVQIEGVLPWLFCPQIIPILLVLIFNCIMTKNQCNKCQFHNTSGHQFGITAQIIEQQTKSMHYFNDIYLKVERIWKIFEAEIAKKI